jgi:hypothetical protein
MSGPQGVPGVQGWVEADSLGCPLHHLSGGPIAQAAVAIDGRNRGTPEIWLASSQGPVD